MPPGVYMAWCGVIPSFLQQLSFNLHHRTAMAAAAVPRSRGVAGGLYFLFTLMCLVCLTSSLMDKDELADIKERNQINQQILEKLKAQKDIFLETVSENMRCISSVMTYLKETGEESQDFLTLVRNMENLKTFVDEQNKKWDAEIEKTEWELKTMGKIIKVLETYHAEL
ncbi:uncharacterized protein LOC144459714 [Epinephelus lanceolatus]